MEQKQFFGIAAVFLIAVLGVGAVSAFGFGDGFMKMELGDEDREEMQAQMDAIQTAIENRDYDAWKSLMEERIAKMQEQLTGENFEQIVEHHQQMSEMREAMDETRAEFCDENDCPDFEGRGHMMHFGMRAE